MAGKHAAGPPSYVPPPGHMGQWKPEQVYEYLNDRKAVVPPSLIPTIDDTNRGPNEVMGKFKKRDDAAFSQTLPEAATHNYHKLTENMPLRRKLLVGALTGAVMYAAVRYEPSMATHADLPWASFDKGYRLFGWNPENTLNKWGTAMEAVGAAVVGANVLLDAKSIARSTYRMGRGAMHSAHNTGAAAKRNFVTRPQNAVKRITDKTAALRRPSGTRRKP